MNIEPIRDPNTIIPPTVGTQNSRRRANRRSYIGWRALASRHAKRPISTTAAPSSINAYCSAPGAEIVPRPSTSVATISTERMPPMWSSGMVDSFTCAGTLVITSTNAMAARGTAMRNTDPHQKYSSSSPATTGPSTAPPAPMADHRAIARARPAPSDHRAVMSARVVGNAMPAATPVKMRPATSTSVVGAQALMALAGTVSARPSSSMRRRPCRSPMAPRYSTDIASPSVQPSAISVRPVCDVPRLPLMSGSATLATDRLMLLTSAPRMSAASTIPARRGAPVASFPMAAT